MESPDEILNIDTPENVVFGYSVAGIGSRFLAALVDTVLIVLLQLLVFFVSLVLFGLIFDFQEGNLEEIFGVITWVQAAFVLLAFFFLWGYYIFFEMRTNGQSPGKKFAKIRVIRVDGTPLTLTESVVRNLVRLVDFLPMSYAIGVVAMFIDSQSRRLGDLAAGTLVVHDTDQSVSLESLASVVDTKYAVYRPVAPGLGPLPVETLGEQDLQIAEDFLARHRELANGPALAAHLLNRLLSRMGLGEANYSYSDNVQLLKEIIRASKGAIMERESGGPLGGVGVQQESPPENTAQ